MFGERGSFVLDGSDIHVVTVCVTNKSRKRAYVKGNNQTKQFKLGGPSKLRSAKILEGFHFVMHVFKKGNRNTKIWHTRLWYVLYLNMGLYAGIYAEDR
jgi:hypothetical protein